MGPTTGAGGASAAAGTAKAGKSAPRRGSGSHSGKNDSGAGPMAPTDASDNEQTPDAQTGVDQNRTGTRASAGKSVLASIAKLKGMKK